VDDEALWAAMANEQLSHYVTDFPNDNITGTKGVIAIPHLGASTPESEENCASMAARQLRDYLLDGNIRNSVNLPDCELPRNGGGRVAVINRNVPNILGQVTTVLAEDKHNIDHMINKSRGDWAYTLFDLDTAIDPRTVKKLQSIEGIERVRVL
jgi:D-3-phosphoglycerate dehydrogenase